MLWLLVKKSLSGPYLQLECYIKQETSKSYIWVLYVSYLAFIFRMRSSHYLDRYKYLRLPLNSWYENNLTVCLILQGTQIVRFSRATFTCARLVRAYVIACCVHAYVRVGTAEPMAWTGMWVMSVFSSIAFRDGDERPPGFVCRVLDKERASFPRSLPRSLPLLCSSTSRSRLSPLFSRDGLAIPLSFSGSRSSGEMPSRCGDCGVVRFNETSNGIEYFSSYRPSITRRFDKRMRRVFAWINLCLDRSRVILPPCFFTSTKWLLIRGLSLCVNYAALIGSLNDRGGPTSSYRVESAQCSMHKLL